MTIAPATLIALHHKLVSNLRTTNLGIVGDASHIATGGYHIGAKTLRINGMSNDYSLEFPIDRNSVSDLACAIDIGGSADKLMLLGNRIVHALENRDPRVYGRVRAVNAPFDGHAEDRRYDCESPSTPADDNCQVSSDRNHIHLEIYRTLVERQYVMDGIYQVLAGIKPAPAPLDPNDPNWSDKVTRAEVVKLIREISGNVADTHVSAAIFGGNDELHKQRPGLYPEAEQGITDRLKVVEDKLNS